MKMTWTFLVVAAVLAVSVSSASIKDVGPNTPEERDWMDNLKDGLEDFMHHMDDKLKNLQDRISRGNKKSRECFKKFKKDFESAVDHDALKHEDYASYVRGIVKNSDNSLNISDFAQRVNAMKDFFEGASEDLNELIKKMKPIVEARMKCTHEAFQAAFGRGGTNATTVADDGSVEETTTDSAAHDDAETATVSDAETTTDDDFVAAADSDAETTTDDDFVAATDSDTETTTDDDFVAAADSDAETTTDGDVVTATDSDTETTTDDDFVAAADSDAETTTDGDVVTATQGDA